MLDGTTNRNQKEEQVSSESKAMSHFQRQYSVSKGTSRFVEDRETGRLIFKRFLGKPIQAALEYGNRRIGKTVPFSDLVAHVSSEVKGATYSDVYRLANKWLQDEMHAIRLGVNAEGLTVTFNQKTRDILHNLNSFMQKHQPGKKTA